MGRKGEGVTTTHRRPVKWGKGGQAVNGGSECKGESGPWRRVTTGGVLALQGWGERKLEVGGAGILMLRPMQGTANMKTSGRQRRGACAMNRINWAGSGR